MLFITCPSSFYSLPYVKCNLVKLESSYSRLYKCIKNTFSSVRYKKYTVTLTVCENRTLQHFWKPGKAK